MDLSRRRFHDRGQLNCKAMLTTDVMRGVVAVHGGYGLPRFKSKLTGVRSTNRAT